jgi:glycosidase
MMRAAHRFGIRVYFDNIMNHNAFDVPGFNESTPIDVYPGMVPEDFHLRVTEEGFYRKWDNTRNWSDAWQVQHLGLSDLIDIATEPGEWNNNFGRNEGDRIRKIRFLRHPQNPEYYCFKPTAPGQKHSNNEGVYVGFGPGNGLTAAFLAANQDYYSEYVEDMLHRSVRWKMDRTRADGLRLDAVKHTPETSSVPPGSARTPAATATPARPRRSSTFRVAFPIGTTTATPCSTPKNRATTP